MSSCPPRSLSGFVAPEVQAELPGLRLRQLMAMLTPGRGRPNAAPRLRALSQRIRGPDVVALRTTAVGHAYRAFFRQVGLDPDVTPIPSERAGIARLRDGELRSVGVVDDACLVALVETGVAVWALDARVVEGGGLGIRPADPAAVADPWGVRAPPGALVIADAVAVHARLFEQPPRGGGIRTGTTHVWLYSVAVQGVSELHVEEALWCASELL